jgi:hypothetical protein
MRNVKGLKVLKAFGTTRKDCGHCRDNIITAMLTSWPKIEESRSMEQLLCFIGSWSFAFRIVLHNLTPTFTVHLPSQIIKNKKASICIVMML